MGADKGGRLLPVPGYFWASDDHGGNRHLDAPPVVALACSTALLVSDSNRDHLPAKPLTGKRLAMGLQHRSLGVGWLLLLVFILQAEESV